MAKNKTTETSKDVNAFIGEIKEEIRRDDAFALVAHFQKQTGFKPKMWGPSIIGFGSYHYKYESGHEGDAPIVAFSPRSTSHVLYLYSDFPKRDELLAKIGKYKSKGGGCLYVKRLADVDLKVLDKMILSSFNHMKKKHS